MPLHIATIVKNASHLNHPLAAHSVQHEMPRLLHPHSTYFRPAELKMVKPYPFHHPLPAPRTSTHRVRFDIPQGLLQ